MALRKPYPPALESSNKGLTLWSESPEEARSFLRRMAESKGLPPVKRIFVAKRSPTSRANNYIQGEYYVTSDDSTVDIFETIVVAPQPIIDLVQWCTCDVMLSQGTRPLVAVEDTTHIVRMNLYQRVPRLVKAASLGVPSIMLQGTRGLDFTKRGDRWALYRYLSAFEAIVRAFPECSPLPLWYVPGTADENAAQDFMVRHIAAILAGDVKAVARQRGEAMAAIRSVLANGFDGTGAEQPPEIPSIENGVIEVVVRIGAKPDKKSWREKGSGQMDPYLGLIVAAKYLYCYDEKGRQTKPLVVEFTYLPSGFWFFADPTSRALYKTLHKQFADEVRFLGTGTDPNRSVSLQLPLERMAAEAKLADPL